MAVNALYLGKDKMMKVFVFLACVLALFGEEVDLSQYEKSIYSENGEDGILAKVFQVVHPTTQFCVEVGAYDGFTHSDTFLLRAQGWKSILFDRRFETPKFNLHKEFINAENVDQIFEKYNVPLEFDLLCIDVDYNDFYVWKALDPKYHPAVVMIRYNANHLPTEDKVVQYRRFYAGDDTVYFSASILALYRLGRAKGYSLIYAENSGKNLFFVRDDLLREETQFKNTNQVDQIYRPPVHSGNEDYKHRPYLSAEDILK